MSERKKRISVSVIFSHLSEEDRIDQACEILAMGVLRFAAKQGMFNEKKNEQPSSTEIGCAQALHPREYSEKKVSTVERIS